MSFLNFFRSARHFSSYDQCPQIYYRFNGQEAYGPVPLDRISSYAGLNPDQVMEGRFADEKTWRPLDYFDDLWDSMPASARTLKRLNNERIEIDPSLTEWQGRELLREKQKSKPPTVTQIKRLQQHGVSPEGILTREQAKARIGVIEQAMRVKSELVAAERKRLKDQPLIIACRKRLTQLTRQVSAFLPMWHPDNVEEFEPLCSYTDLVEEALEYAVAFDSERLLSDLFYDPASSTEYYLEVKDDVPDREIRAFRGRLFVSYIENGGEQFDHITSLRESVPSVIISKV